MYLCPIVLCNRHNTIVCGYLFNLGRGFLGVGSGLFRAESSVWPGSPVVLFLKCTIIHIKDVKELLTE